MTIFLRDYMHRSHEVELPEGTTKVVGIIMTGDEILIYPVYCDTTWKYRATDTLDGVFCRVYEDGEWKDVEIPDGKEVQPEQPRTCKSCRFYENDCPFIRGKFLPYPSKVCKDYTEKEVEL